MEWKCSWAGRLRTGCLADMWLLPFTSARDVCADKHQLFENEGPGPGNSV